MSVLLGVPLAIRDQDIFTPLPNFPESQFQTKAATIHVKLTKVFGQVVDSESILIPHIQNILFNYSQRFITEATFWDLALSR